ncbi:MAG: hypothetical protein NW226_26750 [Microscillaceae bacterium]|nr:hypothetical protein [Microscillaceae bacterium]
MKPKSFIISVLFFSSLFFLLISDCRPATVSAPIYQEIDTTTRQTWTPFAPLQLSELLNMSRKEVEQKLHRRLNFKERLTLFLLKHQAKRLQKLSPGNDDCPKLKKKAERANFFGIFGFFFLGMIFGIVAIVNGVQAIQLAEANPDCPEVEKYRKKATVGIVFGVLGIIFWSIFLTWVIIQAAGVVYI